MKKLLIISFAIVLNVAFVLSHAGLLIDRVYVDTPGPGPPYNDDFTAGLGDWQQVNSTWTTNAQDRAYCTSPSGQYYWMIYSNPTTGFTQRVETSMPIQAASNFSGIILWSTGFSGGDDNVILVYYRLASQFLLCTEGNDFSNETCENPCIYTIDLGDYFCTRITGAQNNATVDIYDNDSSPNCQDRVDWTNPDCSFPNVDLSRGGSITRGLYSGLVVYDTPVPTEFESYMLND